MAAGDRWTSFAGVPSTFGNSVSFKVDGSKESSLRGRGREFRDNPRKGSCEGSLIIKDVDLAGAPSRFKDGFCSGKGKQVMVDEGCLSKVQVFEDAQKVILLKGLFLEDAV